jgi:hypothetical protein
LQEPAASVIPVRAFHLQTLLLQQKENFMGNEKQFVALRLPLSTKCFLAGCRMTFVSRMERLRCFAETNPKIPWFFLGDHAMPKYRRTDARFIRF